MRSFLSSLVLAIFLSSHSFAQNSNTSFRPPEAFSISGKFVTSVPNSNSNSDNSSYEETLCSYKLVLIHENEFKIAKCGDYNVAMFYLTINDHRPTVHRTLYRTQPNYIPIDIKKLDSYHYQIQMNAPYQTNTETTKSCPMTKVMNIAEDKFYSGCEYQFIVRLFYSEQYDRPVAMKYQWPQLFSNVDVLGNDLPESQTVLKRSRNNSSTYLAVSYQNLEN